MNHRRHHGLVIGSSTDRPAGPATVLTKKYPRHLVPFGTGRPPASCGGVRLRLNGPDMCVIVRLRLLPGVCGCLMLAYALTWMALFECVDGSDGGSGCDVASYCVCRVRSVGRACPKGFVRATAVRHTRIDLISVFFFRRSSDAKGFRPVGKIDCSNRIILKWTTYACVHRSSPVRSGVS